MVISNQQQEALDQAKKHGGKLIRWRGGMWTFEGAACTGENWCGVPEPEWYCTTNTIFALVRRGYLVMDGWGSCSLGMEEPKRKKVDRSTMRSDTTGT